MPDIFGRNPEDYGSVRALQSAGLWDRHQAALSREMGVPPHNFNALASQRGMARAEVNAQAVGFMTDNLLAIRTMVDEILYLVYRLPDYLTLVTNIPEGARSYGIQVRDRTGRGRYIDPDGNDAPRATSSRRLITQPLDLGGIDAYWTLDEVRGAMLAGVPLETEHLEAAVMGASEHMEAVGLLGDNERGTKGLLNQAPGTVTYTAGVAAGQANPTQWSGMTAVQIRDVINGAISALISNTREIFGRTIQDGLTIYLPTTQFDLLSSKYVGDNQEWSVMRSIMEDNPWKYRTGNQPMFESVPELTGVGAGDSDRMVVSIKDERIAQMGVSIQPRVIKIEESKRQFCAPVEYKFSPPWILRPKQLHYYDNI